MFPTSFSFGVGFDRHRILFQLPEENSSSTREGNISTSETKSICTLAGIEISPHLFVLGAHSDGDVLFHALIDAIFAVEGCGDIGERFPNTSPEFRGISSEKLFQFVLEETRFLEKWVVQKCQVILFLEKPSLKEVKPRIREKLKTCLHIQEDSQMVIHAKTGEGVGVVGQSLSIDAQVFLWVTQKDNDKPDSVY